MKYYYDSQIRRYLLQINRVFSEIQYEYSSEEGAEILRTVPVMSGNIQRDVAQIIKGNTENSMMPIPCFSTYITNLDISSERRANPTHESSVHITERKLVDGTYTNEAGKKITIDRYMPVPYDLTVNVDLVTSKLETKLQIMEQILTIFNPSIQLQTNSNYADWTNIFELELTDVTWTSLNIPIGNDVSRDVTTFTFKVPIWINPPAKIKQQKLIENIVQNIRSMRESDDFSDNTEGLGDPLYGRYIVTFNNYEVYFGMDGYNSNELVVLPNEFDKNPSWKEIIKEYGRIVPGVTRIRLNNNGFENIKDDIIADIDFGESDDTLIMTIDPSSLPSLTLGQFNRMVDPNINFPSVDLPDPVAGTRYMFVSSLSDGEEPAISIDNKYWGITNVNNGGIVEYDGFNWTIVFNGSSNTEYVYSIEEDTILKYNDGHWEYAYFGKYGAGYWRFENIQDDESVMTYVNQC